MSGPLFRFFSDDHRRLDALLDRATATPGRIELVAFGEFRGGILRHIAMEEKVLIPAARRSRSGRALPIAAKLRVDHGAIAAILVPTPTPAIVADLRSVLVPHNRREEERGGLYETCDEGIGEPEAERLVAELRAFPAVPLNPHRDGPLVVRHVRETLDLARRQWRE
ncbi:MAG TPA: hemerythrin domain-containing protein [Vicinamibacteria bacterium]|nr:hemerythrin domain-containing protein [Vicinamibacteria bacterium]